MYKFINHIKTKYLSEDWSIFTKTGKFFLKPAWFIRACLVWVCSFLLFPLILLDMNSEKFKKEVTDLYYDMLKNML